MDFARKQLEKYGWTDGKGLGKNENGISQALKPKLKRSVTGVGHDPASDFNEHWWTSLYDKAAGNVQVKDTNGTTKKIKTKDDFKITNNMWQIKQKPKNDNKEQYDDFFVRTEVMCGGNKTEKVKDSDSEEDVKSKDVFKMTDEELFAACEGRTAHKGARHGLRATGKLARIAKQEKLLLSQAKYNDYSHAKKIKEVEKVVDEVHFYTEDESDCSKKKKKKRKHCLSNENRRSEENLDVRKAQELADLKNREVDHIDIDENIGRKKTKKLVSVVDNSVDLNDVQELTKKKKKRKYGDLEKICLEIDDVGAAHEEFKNVKKKKKTKLKVTE